MLINACASKGTVYTRAQNGFTPEQAFKGDAAIETFLPMEARLSAWAAGARDFNRRSKAAMTAKNGQNGGKYGLNANYTKSAYGKLTGAQKANVQASTAILDAFGQEFGLKINLVDSIEGGKANGRFDRASGQIDIALDAMDGAYTYIGLHEATHSLKANSTEAFDYLATTVREVLEAQGQDVDALVKEQMEKYGYDDDTALEEVVANTVPSILSDPETTKRMVSGNRTLAQKIHDAILEVLDFLDRQFEKLKKRGDWKQMQALETDVEGLRKIERALFEGLESVKENAKVEKGTEIEKVRENIKESPKEGYTEEGLPVYSSNFPEGTTRKERQNHILDLVQNVWAKKTIQLEIAKNGKQMVITANFDPYVDYQNSSYSDATKLAFGNRKGTMADQKTTEKLADDFPDIIANSSYVSDKSETGKDNPAHKNVLVWNYFANHIGFINEKGRYAEYNVNIDVKQTANGHYVYSVGAEKIKGSECETSPTLHDNPKTILASVNGITPAIANTIIPNSTENVNPKFSLRSNSDQIKSATDNVGTFEPTSPDTHYSLNEDSTGRSLSNGQADYFAMSKARDEEGRLLKLYHGTESTGFTVFEQRGDKGFFFTDSLKLATVYGGQNQSIFAPGPKTNAFEQEAMEAFASSTNRFEPERGGIYESYLNLEDPLELDAKGAEWDHVRGRGREDKRDRVRTTNEWADIAYEQGYDGVIFRNIKDGSDDVGTVCAAFAPEQIKSVNNANPTSDPDIRYSLREDDKNVQASMDAMQSAFQQTKGHRLNAVEAEKLASGLRQEFNADIDVSEIANRIARAYNLAESAGADASAMAQMHDELAAVATDVLEKSKTLNREHEERAKPIREYLRKTPIRLTEGQWAEAASQAGSMGAYRRALFGRVRLSNDGLLVRSTKQS